MDVLGARGAARGGVSVPLICALVQKRCLRRATLLRKMNFREPPTPEVRRTTLPRGRVNTPLGMRSSEGSWELQSSAKPLPSRPVASVPRPDPFCEPLERPPLRRLEHLGADNRIEVGQGVEMVALRAPKRLGAAVPQDWLAGLHLAVSPAVAGLSHVVAPLLVVSVPGASDRRPRLRRPGAPRLPVGDRGRETHITQPLGPEARGHAEVPDEGYLVQRVAPLPHTLWIIMQAHYPCSRVAVGYSPGSPE